MSQEEHRSDRTAGGGGAGGPSVTREGEESQRSTRILPGEEASVEPQQGAPVGAQQGYREDKDHKWRHRWLPRCLALCSDTNS